jgi:hypothetical protein
VLGQLERRQLAAVPVVDLQHQAPATAGDQPPDLQAPDAAGWAHRLGVAAAVEPLLVQVHRAQAGDRRPARRSGAAVVEQELVWGVVRALRRGGLRVRQRRRRRLHWRCRPAALLGLEPGLLLLILFVLVLLHHDVALVAPARGVTLEAAGG